jgi:hypothetical protein
MQKVVFACALAVCGLAIEPAFYSFPSIAHQQHQLPTTNSSDPNALSVMIHLDPDDTPHAGHPSETWFMLMRADGRVISPADCNCWARVYDFQGETVFHHLSLSNEWIDGQAVFSTSITFPSPGAYTVVFGGESNNASFEPFEMTFPVTAVMPPVRN